MRPTLVQWVWVTLALTCSPRGAAAELTAQDILTQTDEVRNPQLDYTTTVTVTSLRAARAPRSAAYEVLIKGRRDAVIKTVSPAIDQGRVLLMHDNDLWAFLPTVSKPLRVSLRERLIGEVANGDLARANFSGDYTPEIAEMQTIDRQTYFVLNLTATSGEVTYARVVLWVDAATFFPHHAEFYAVSGRLLKTCTYQRYRELGGRLRPTQLVMKDALATSQYSVLEYDHMEIKELPDKLFTKDYMKKFME